jgi:tartrate-resistant acid phosphatase type 5
LNLSKTPALSTIQGKISMFTQVNRSSAARSILIFVLFVGASFSASALHSTSDVLPALVSQVGSSTNDAEESVNSGNVSVTSPDLQLGADNNAAQLVGIRFTNIGIPRNARIVSAYVEFEVAEISSGAASVTIRGQASDNAPAFSSTKHNISARSRTTAQVAWNNIPSWPTLNAKWQTPNLSAVIQEIVNRPNWAGGNSIALIITGSGRRTAESYDGEPPAAPKLIVNYTTPSPTPTQTPLHTSTPLPPGSAIQFAVIGDYGNGSQPEQDVANLIKSWNPHFIITTGDNNYPSGAANTIDANIGQYYHGFIYPYGGSYGPGATTNRFFPSLGNHDWESPNAHPYLNYFTLPGNERYYDFVWGPVHFFVLDSDPQEPDGISSSSTQALWLQAKLAASTAPWKLVYMHHPPFSSGADHGSTPSLQWPYQAWGADAVLTGHDHTYERIFWGGIPYFVNGLGGAAIYPFGAPVSGSQVRYNADYGAMRVFANATQVTFQFINRAGAVIDSYTLHHPPTPTPTFTPTFTPTVTSTPTDTPTPLPPPSVVQIVRSTPEPINLATVNFSVTFSQSVTGVDPSDFVLTTTGVSGAALSGISGSGSIYTVTVNTGTGNGTVRLDLVDDDSIVNVEGTPLDGPGPGNGNFTGGETYTITKDVVTHIGGVLTGAYMLGPSESTRDSYAKNAGPVKVQSLGGGPIIVAERDAWLLNGVVQSFSEMMGLPGDQVTDTYYFPWYNNVTMDTQLRFANLGDTSTDVTVTIAGVAQPVIPLAAGVSTRVSYPVNAGPVKVESSGGVPIIVAERDAWLLNGVVQSFSEMMGLPGNRLTDTYYFPWYNNINMDTQLRVANLGTTSTDITVTIAGVAQPVIPLAAGESTRVSYPVNDGPVKVQSSGGVPIIVAERDAWLINGVVQSFSEMMGLAANQLTDIYYFPWYNNVAMDTQLRFANLGDISTDVTVTIAGVAQLPITVAPGTSTRISYPVNNGPVRVESSGGVPIIVAERDAWLLNGAVRSFSEMMGLPGNQLTATYYFPWYNNLTMDTQLRLAMP